MRRGGPSVAPGPVVAEHPPQELLGLGSAEDDLESGGGGGGGGGGRLDAAGVGMGVVDGGVGGSGADLANGGGGFAGYSRGAVVAGFWLLAWLVNNIGVTLLNKSAFHFVDFKYPYMLSAVHMLCNTAGAELYFLWFRDHAGVEGHSAFRKQLSPEQYRIILAFSVIFALNIGVGNASLRYVSVNFNQVMRSLVPGVVMLLGRPFLNKVYSREQRLALVPVVVGVMLACFGEMHFTYVGFVVTCGCVALAAAKVVISSLVLTGEMKLGPVDLLSRMCPLAFVECLLLSLVSGEVTDIAGRWNELSASYAFPIVLLSGVSSFSLNITSLFANKSTSALTLSVCANAKQALMIVIATLVFGTPISVLNGVGIFIVLMGSAQYSHVSYLESQRNAKGAG